MDRGGPRRFPTERRETGIGFEAREKAAKAAAVQTDWWVIE